MMESGRGTSGKDTASKFGQMELNTKVNGLTIRQRARVSSHMSMVIYTTGTGNKTRPQDRVFTFTTMVPDTKESG